MSLAKVAGVLYAFLGFLFGALITLFSLVGGAFMPKESGGMGMLFGAAAIIALPIFYGALGFILSLISAWFYNVIAGWVGGVELET